MASGIGAEQGAAAVGLGTLLSRTTHAGVRRFIRVLSDAKVLITAIDLAGDSSFRDWAGQAEHGEPKLVLLVVDYKKVMDSEVSFDEAMLHASVVKDLAPGCLKALVLTHTDMVEDSADRPELAVEAPRSRSLARRLGAVGAVSGDASNISDRERIGSEVAAWLA